MTEDLAGLMCPHSAAGRPERFPAKACILAGECGCVYGAEWSRALRLADDAADRARLAETRLIEAEQRAERAEARVAELEADARRWRKCKRMRKSWWLEAMTEAGRKGGRSLDEQIDEQPDAAIDAAMTKEQKT